jgi:hypothetical protein
MNPIRDGFGILIDSARMMGKTEPAYLLLVMVGALLLAGAAWWGAVNYTKLWNLRFTPTALHHAMCGLAAFLTLLFTIAFASLGHAREVANKEIEAWKAVVSKDQKLIVDSSTKAYYAVRDAGVETLDPRHHGIGTTGGSYPVTKDETRKMVAEIYLKYAIDNFGMQHPYLLNAIWKRRAINYDRVVADRQAFKGRTYPISRYFTLAGQQIQEELGPQTPRVVGSARRWLAALFLLAQALPFGLIGWAAYRDLQERY